jgi:hypothetical protein
MSDTYIYTYNKYISSLSGKDVKKVTPVSFKDPSELLSSASHKGGLLNVYFLAVTASLSFMDPYMSVMRKCFLDKLNSVSATSHKGSDRSWYILFKNHI